MLNSNKRLANLQGPDFGLAHKEYNGIEYFCLLLLNPLQLCQDDNTQEQTETIGSRGLSSSDWCEAQNKEKPTKRQ